MIILSAPSVDNDNSIRGIYRYIGMTTDRYICKYTIYQTNIRCIVVVSVATET